MNAVRGLVALLLLLSSYTTSLAASSIWMVKSRDQVIYLGGTVHVLRASDYPLPIEFDAAYVDSDAVVFETDIAKLANPKTRELMRKRLRYDDGRTLSRVLSREAYEALARESATMGISLAPFETFRPVTVLLAVLALELERLGVSAQGVDKHFHARALADGKSVAALETVAAQMEVLAAMGEGRESSFVAHGLEELKETSGMLEEAIGAWRLGDEKRLARVLLERTERNYPELYRSLIVERNRDWLPKIENLFEQPGREFVLVGVAHLVGEDGLLRELERRGYEVRQLKSGGARNGTDGP